MICPNCKNETKNEKFCDFCGRPISKPYIKTDVDRDYDKAINREMNDSEHRRLYG